MCPPVRDHLALPRPEEPRQWKPKKLASRGQSLPSTDQYWAAIDRVKPVSLVSIDGVLQDEEGRDGRALVDTLTTAAHEDPSHNLDVTEVKRHLKDAVKALPEKQRHCIMMYYGKDLCRSTS